MDYEVKLYQRTMLDLLYLSLHLEKLIMFRKGVLHLLGHLSNENCHFHTNLSSLSLSVLFQSILHSDKMLVCFKYHLRTRELRSKKERTLPLVWPYRNDKYWIYKEIVETIVLLLYLLIMTLVIFLTWIYPTPVDLIYMVVSSLLLYLFFPYLCGIFFNSLKNLFNVFWEYSLLLKCTLRFTHFHTSSTSCPL